MALEMPGRRSKHPGETSSLGEDAPASHCGAGSPLGKLTAPRTKLRGFLILKACPRLLSGLPSEEHDPSAPPPPPSPGDVTRPAAARKASPGSPPTPGTPAGCGERSGAGAAAEGCGEAGFNPGCLQSLDQVNP